MRPARWWGGHRYLRRSPPSRNQCSVLQRASSRSSKAPGNLRRKPLESFHSLYGENEWYFGQILYVGGHLPRRSQSCNHMIGFCDLVNRIVWSSSMADTFRGKFTRVCLPSQSASEKKAHKPLHTSWFSEKCLVFDNHKNLVILTLAAWSAFRALFTRSRRTTFAKDHGLFYHSYPQIDGVIKSDHVTANLL